SGHQDATGTVLVKDFRLASEAAVRVDDHAGRVLAGNPPHGQLWIVGYRSTDADNNRVDQCPQSVEAGQSGRPVDVFGMPRFRRKTAIERLTDLADHHQLVDDTPAKRVEKFTPGLRKRLVTRPENIAKL